MYQRAHSSHVCLIGGPLIQMDPQNDDYKIYLQWVAAGNTAQPPDPGDRPTQIAAILNYARSLRGQLFAVVDGLQSSALTLGNSVDATAIETFKAGLRNITKIDLSLATTDAHMRALVLTQYKTLAEAAPASVQLAFRQAVQ